MKGRPENQIGPLSILRIGLCSVLGLVAGATAGLIVVTGADDEAQAGAASADDRPAQVASTTTTSSAARTVSLVVPQDLVAGDVIFFGFEIGPGSPIIKAHLIVNGVAVSSAETPDELSWLAQEGSHSIALRVETADGGISQSETTEIDVRGGLSDSSTTTAPISESSTTTAPLVVAQLSPSQLTVSASSELAPVDGLTYWASNVVDGNSDTAWNHNSATAGPVGQWLRFDLGTPALVHSIRITNGYIKSTQVFERNHRVRDMTVELIGANGKTRTTGVTLSDSQSVQTIELEADFVVSSVKLSVDSVYVGSTWDDLAITAVEIWALS